jgi:hypothetical protein
LTASGGEWYPESRCGVPEDETMKASFVAVTWTLFLGVVFTALGLYFAA